MHIDQFNQTQTAINFIIAAVKRERVDESEIKCVELCKKPDDLSGEYRILVIDDAGSYGFFVNAKVSAEWREKSACYDFMVDGVEFDFDTPAGLR